MTNILSPEEMAEFIIEGFSPFVTTWDCYHDCPADPKRIRDDAKKCGLFQVDLMISLFLGEKSCAPVQGQGLVMDINYWLEVRNKLKEI